MANADRLMALSMVPALAEEVAAQIDGATPAPVPYSETPADLAAALVAAGLMEPDA